MKRYHLIILSFGLAMAIVGSMTLIASAQYSAITFTQNTITSDIGAAAWTGPMAWSETYGGNGTVGVNANFYVSGLGSNGTMVINYACTATGNTYWGGRSFFYLYASDNSTLFSARADGGEAASQSAPSRCTDSMALTLTWTGDTPVRLAWNGDWAANFTVDISSIYVNGQQVFPANILATPFPQEVMPCITMTAATSPTVVMTQTPIWGPTATPRPTSSGNDSGPGSGATATPTPGPTQPGQATNPSKNPPGALSFSYDTGVMHFNRDTEKLSAAGSVNTNKDEFLSWSAETGPDGGAGVVMMHAGADAVITQSLVSSAVAMVAILKPDGYVPPLGLKLSARTAYTLTSGDQASLSVWYLDPEYDSHGPAWVKVADKSLSNIWRQFGVVVSPLGGSGKMTAIGFTDNYVSYHYNYMAPCPGQAGCIYLDDLRLTYGDANAIQFSACSGSDIAGGLGSHYCMIAVHTVDVMGQLCPKPSSLLDIGGYVGWLGCSLKVYFTILPENSSQINAVTNYSGSLEPFGSMHETADGLGYVQSNLGTFSTNYVYYTRNTTDWGKFFDWMAVTHMQFPTITGHEVQSSLLATPNCQFAQLNTEIPD